MSFGAIRYGIPLLEPYSSLDAFFKEEYGEAEVWNDLALEEKMPSLPPCTGVNDHLSS